MVPDSRNGVSWSNKLKTGLADNWQVLSVIAAAMVVAALMLWLLQPKDPELLLYKPDDAKTAGYQADATNCSPEALASIRNVRKRSAQRNDCADKAEDHRLKTDDLIQQTRAADAARAQAISAGYQSRLALWATVGGFLTLVAAGLAAAYARDAAKEGKTANQIARHASEVSANSLRPRIIVSADKEKLSDGNASFIVYATNLGKEDCVIEYFLAEWRKTDDFGEVSGYVAGYQQIIVRAGATVDIAYVESPGAPIATPYYGGLIVYRSPQGTEYKAYFLFWFITNYLRGGRPPDYAKAIVKKGTGWPDST